MRAVASRLTGLVAVEHVGIMVLEMFFWDHPVGRGALQRLPRGQALPAALALAAYFLSRTSSSGADHG